MTASHSFLLSFFKTGIDAAHPPDSLGKSGRWWGRPRNIIMSINPRYANGNTRRKIRARLRFEGAPCHICQGKLGPIHYDEPSNAAHPLSFVVDEIIPISRAEQYGYESRAAAAQDLNNVAPAHWICNARKGNKINFKICEPIKAASQSDGDW